MSYGRIEKETGLSRRSCINLIQELIDHELVKLIKRGGTPHFANRYVIKTYRPD